MAIAESSDSLHIHSRQERSQKVLIMEALMDCVPDMTASPVNTQKAFVAFTLRGNHSMDPHKVINPCAWTLIIVLIQRPC